MKKVKNISIIIVVVTSVLFLFGIKNYAVNENNSNVTDNTLNQSTNSNTNTESTNTPSTNTPSTNTRSYKFYSNTKY